MKLHLALLAVAPRLGAMLLAACLAMPAAFAQFIQTGTGPYNYRQTQNWNGGLVNGVFSQAPTAAQVVVFTGNDALSSGLTFSLVGNTTSLTLQGSGGDYTATLSGDVSVTGTGSTISFGSTTAGGKLNLDLGETGRTFSVATGNLLYVTNGVSGSGALTKTGGGQLTLAGPSTYSGGTTVNHGVLTLNASGALPAAGDILVNATSAGTKAQLVVGGGFAQTAGTLTFGGAGQTSTSANNVFLDAGSTLTLGGNVFYRATGNPTTPASITGTGTLVLGGARVFDIADSTGTASELNIFSAISGAFSLTKTGAGRLTLNNPNSTYSGGTFLNGGELYLNASDTLPWSGAVTFSDSGGAPSNLILGANHTQTIGALTFGQTAASPTTVSTVFLESGSTLTLNGTVTYNATGNPSQVTVTGSGTLDLGGSRTFNVGNSSTTTAEVQIGTIVANGSVTKTGAGALSFSGPGNTYAGGTTVSAGGLIVSNTAGSGVGTGPLVIQSGAFLRGPGIIGAATTLESGGMLGTGGTGGTPGALTFTNGLTLNDGAVFNFQLGTASDKFVISGGVLTGSTGSSALTINLTAGPGFTVGTYTLLDFSSGATTSNFDLSDFTLGAALNGYAFTLAIVDKQLQLTAVPEPATCAALFAAASLVGAMFHRRRHAAASRRDPRGAVPSQNFRK